MEVRVLILTPLAVERAAVLRHLDKVGMERLGNSLYDIGYFTGKHHRFRITLRETGSKNAVVSGAASEAIGIIKPAVAFLLGVCGGIKDVLLGDLVVAEKAYNYDGGKITGDGFNARPDSLPFSKELLTAAHEVARLPDWRKRTQNGTTDARVFFGPIASGDKVIAHKESEQFIQIKRFFNDTTAVEMESHGFAQAAYNFPDVRVLNIRGVSDLIDGKREADEKGSQETASDLAAAFAMELLYGLDCSAFPNVNLSAPHTEHSSDKTSINNSKNIIAGSNITLHGGGLHIGDIKNIIK